MPCCMLNRLFGAWLGSLTGVCALGSWRTPQWERECCINWAARDDSAPRLPQQALDSQGRRLLTAQRDVGALEGKVECLDGSNIGVASSSSVWQSVNCVMKFGNSSSSTVWYTTFIPRRCVPRPNSTKPKLGWELTDGGRRIWQTYRGEPSQHFRASWRHVNESWPGRRSGWRFSPLCSQK